MRALTEGVRKVTEAWTDGLRTIVAASTVSRLFSVWRQSPDKAVSYLEDRDNEELISTAEFAAWTMAQCGRILGERLRGDG